MWLTLALTVFSSQAAGPETAQLVGLPGVDASKLSASAQAELLRLLTDEFDYCGRALTVLGSLKKGDACAHTRRLASWAASQVAQGGTAMEVGVVLAKYNAAFGGKRATFSPDARQCVGPSDAKITVVEFSDFQCPYCAAARPVLEAFAKSRPDVRFCSMLFPLNNHPHSTAAATAALVARDNGKFWPVHDAMFDGQDRLSDASIRQILKNQKLSVEAFERALTQPTVKLEIENQKNQGRQAGVDSTPTLYVNGRKFLLTITPESLALGVDDELDWQKNAATWMAKTAGNKDP